MEAIKLDDHRKKEPEHSDSDDGDNLIHSVKIVYCENGYMVEIIWRDDTIMFFVLDTPKDVYEFLKDYL